MESSINWTSGNAFPAHKCLMFSRMQWMEYAKIHMHPFIDCPFIYHRITNIYTFHEFNSKTMYEFENIQVNHIIHKPYIRSWFECSFSKNSSVPSTNVHLFFWYFCESIDMFVIVRKGWWMGFWIFLVIITMKWKKNQKKTDESRNWSKYQKNRENTHTRGSRTLE